MAWFVNSKKKKKNKLKNYQTSNKKLNTYLNLEGLKNKIVI